MPRISAFYGIVIWMYRPDHPPAHFHAQYGEAWAKLAFDGQLLEGGLPPRALRLVRQWTRLHVGELYANWERALAREELVPIAPLE